jgi:hypothetical protein
VFEQQFLAKPLNHRIDLIVSEIGNSLDCQFSG